MITRTLSMLLQLRLTVGYAMALVGVAATLVVLGPGVQDHVIQHMSTNLHNLGHGRLVTLIGSAFITSEGPMWVWLPGLVCLLGLAELLWRSRRVLITFVLGHIGATLIVAVGLATAIEVGWLPISIARATDVGMSYGAAAVLGALTAAIPSRWRPMWIGWWVSVGLLMVYVGTDFTNGGHFVALLLGILVSMKFGGGARWTRARVVLLMVSISFGYLILVNTGLSLVVVPIVGLAGALTAHWVASWWRARRAQPAVPVADPATA